MWLLLGCTAALAPGELVLGADVAATFQLGHADARLGAAVAAGPQVLAAAPGEGLVYADGVGAEGPSTWVGWWGDRPVRAGAEAVWVDGALYATPGPMRGFAAGPFGLIGMGQDTVLLFDPLRAVPLTGVEAVGVGEDRFLAIVCAPDCAALEIDADGAPSAPLAPAGPGGGVGEWEGQLWAGAPDLDTDDAPGEVCAEDGTCVEGLPGDHLGLAIGGGYTVGMFNRVANPPRARVVPLDTGPTYALERGAELQPMTVHGDTDTLVIGVPYYPAHGVVSGAVVIVGR